MAKIKYKVGTNRNNTYYTSAQTPAKAALNIWHKHHEVAKEFWMQIDNQWRRCMPS